MKSFLLVFVIVLLMNQALGGHLEELAAGKQMVALEETDVENRQSFKTYNSGKAVASGTTSYGLEEPSTDGR